MPASEVDDQEHLLSKEEGAKVEIRNTSYPRHMTRIRVLVIKRNIGFLR